MQCDRHHGWMDYAKESAKAAGRGCPKEVIRGCELSELDGVLAALRKRVIDS